MENLPNEILRFILNYVGGHDIHFQRDETGRVQAIIGLKDDHMSSKTMFTYDDESTVVHCSTNLNEDCKECSDLIDPITMVDFHIIPSRKDKWYCAVDYTELNTHTQTVEKIVKSYRFFYNEHNKIIKFEEDGSSVYTVEYDDAGRKILYSNASKNIEYEYDGDLRIRSREFQGDELFQEFEYEYTTDCIGPVAMYDVSNEIRSLCQENIFLSHDVDVPKLNACDGVQRNYYTKDGSHLASYYLPPQTETGPSFLLLRQMLDIPDDIPDLFVSLTNPETNARRIIQKENNRLFLDMTIEFVDGKLSKVSHNPKAGFNGMAMSLIEKYWWQ